MLIESSIFLRFFNVCKYFVPLCLLSITCFIDNANQERNTNRITIELPSFISVSSAALTEFDRKIDSIVYRVTIDCRLFSPSLKFRWYLFDVFILHVCAIRFFDIQFLQFWRIIRVPNDFSIREIRKRCSFCYTPWHVWLRINVPLDSGALYLEQQFVSWTILAYFYSRHISNHVSHLHIHIFIVISDLSPRHGVYSQVTRVIGC